LLQISLLEIAKLLIFVSVLFAFVSRAYKVGLFQKPVLLIILSLGLPWVLAILGAIILRPGPRKVTILLIFAFLPAILAFLIAFGAASWGLVSSLREFWLLLYFPPHTAEPLPLLAALCCLGYCFFIIYAFYHVTVFVFPWRCPACGCRSVLRELRSLLARWEVPGEMRCCLVCKTRYWNDGKGHWEQLGGDEDERASG